MGNFALELVVLFRPDGEPPAEFLVQARNAVAYSGMSMTVSRQALVRYLHRCFQRSPTRN